MSQALEYRLLKPSDFPALYQGFLGAFSDYQASLQPSTDELRQRFKRVGVDYGLSAATFLGKEVVGFILTGRGAFNGVPTAYNAGTGVVPQFRRRGIAEKLYRMLFPEFRKKGLGQCLLEVINTNQSAYHFYEGLGFQQKRLLHCFAAPQPIQPLHPKMEGLNIKEVALADWTSYEQLWEVEPSWQNNALAVERARNQETVLEAYYQTALIGYIIFSPALGYISQIAVEPQMQGKGIGTALLLKAQSESHKRLAILNVDAQSSKTCIFLKNRGFHRPFTQKEMMLEL